MASLTSLKLLSCSNAIVHRSSIEGRSSSGWGGYRFISATWRLNSAVGRTSGFKSYAIRCCNRSSEASLGISCSLRESASGLPASLPGRNMSLNLYREKIKDQRTYRSVSWRTFIKYSRFLWSVRIVKSLTLRSSASHSSRQRMMARSSLS
jgi:hypothetical protein